MTELAVLTAIVMILQLGGLAIPAFGTSISLVLIPIALGAMVLGPWAGAFLGAVFGAIVYINGGVMGADVFTNFLFVNSPVMTALICFVKSTVAGFVGGILYKIIVKKNAIAAVFVCAAAIPIINTGLFIIGCLIIIDTIEAYMASQGIGGTAIYFLFILCAGVNFILEFAVNMILSPALSRVIAVLGKRIRKTR